MRRFAVILVGQAISLLGSGLTNFVMAVWVYQKSQSTTLFALSLLSGFLPYALLLPIAGAVVDRTDRRRLLILLDSAAAAVTGLLALLVKTERLGFGQVCMANAVLAGLDAYQVPALMAATGTLVAKEDLTRASGLSQAATAAAQIGAPLLAGVLLPAIGTHGIVLLDSLSYIASVGTIVSVPFPSPSHLAVSSARFAFWREISDGWRHLRALPGLMPLLTYFAVVNLHLSLGSVLVTPLVLHFASPVVLGGVASAASAGMLSGGLALGVWGGPKRRVAGTLTAGFIFGLFLFGAGLRQSPRFLALCLFGAYFALPVMVGSFRAIWQSQIPPDAHGRAAATVQLVAQSTTPVALVAAGPLADRVFEPLLRRDGSLAGTVGALLGTGPGRGTGLIFVLLGVLTILATWVAWGLKQTWLAETDTRTSQ